jgi:hypothetical protein
MPTFEKGIFKVFFVYSLKPGRRYGKVANWTEVQHCTETGCSVLQSLVSLHTENERCLDTARWQTDNLPEMPS